jgi:drug/metabolite transporter (DMT)-like permease
MVFISTITYTWATAMTSFPIVMAFKSCNILSILLVAILCTRVRDKQLNLGRKKLVVGIIISAGVFFFSYFDPEQKERSQQSQWLGIFLLFVSLMADGFLPDFQAEIKAEFKPQPTEMMEHINKWVAIISLTSMIASLTAKNAFIYMLYHPMFMMHLMSLSILSALGQFVVYTMIKLFKQHIVPFMITVRKILTVAISIVYYQHRTSSVQLLGMLLVVTAVVYEFISEVRKNEGHKCEQSHENSQRNLEKEPTSAGDFELKDELSIEAKTTVEKTNGEEIGENGAKAEPVK